MLVAHPPAMTTDVCLLVVLILLPMVLLMILMLEFVSHIHLHITLVPGSIHHHLLRLLMPLVVHAIRIVGRGLRYGRA